MLNKKLILPVYLLLTLPLFSASFKITGYLPSYRLESTERAVGNSVLDLTGYIPGYEADRTKNIRDFPRSYKVKSIESWYGNNLSDIIYFSIKPGLNGSLDLSSIKERDLERLKNINNFFNTELHISVSGNSDRFFPVSSDENLREIFIKNLYDFCRDNNFSGVDFDWEFPQTEEEINKFYLLISDTVNLFNSNNMTVSAAVSRHRPLNQEIYNKLNIINLMTYDFVGRHSTYESTVEAVEYMMIAYGIPPGKIKLGIPFYGRIYNGRHPQYWSKAMSYSQIRDNFASESSGDEAGGYYFNDIETVIKKTNYAKENNLGGVMIWELGQDTLDEYSLLNAINGAIY